VGAPGRALSRAHEELIGAAPRVGARPPVARRWGAAPRRGDNSEATAAAVGASSAGFGVIAGQGTYRWAGGGGARTRSVLRFRPVVCRTRLLAAKAPSRSRASEAGRAWADTGAQDNSAKRSYPNSYI